MSEENFHITKNVNFFVLDAKNIHDPVIETTISQINKKNYNFGIIVNCPDESSLKNSITTQCFCIDKSEKYFVQNIIQHSNTNIIQDSNTNIIQDSNTNIIQHSNTNIIQDSNTNIIQDTNPNIIQDGNTVCLSDLTKKNDDYLEGMAKNKMKMKHKIIFVNMLKLFKDKMGCEFFEWLKEELSQMTYDNFFIVSNSDPFYLSQFDTNNEKFNRFLNVMIKCEYHYKISFLVSHHMDKYFDPTLTPILSEFSEKIKIFNTNPTNLTNNYEFISTPNQNKKNKLFDVANNYYYNIRYSYLEIKIDQDVCIIEPCTKVTCSADVTKFIVNSMIRISSDIKLNGCTEKKKNIFQWYNGYATKFGCFESYEKIVKFNKLHLNILRKNFLVNAIIDIRSCIINFMTMN